MPHAVRASLGVGLMAAVALWGLAACSDDAGTQSVCGNGKVGPGEECDCGTDPDHLPPGCVAPNGAKDSTCSADCRRLTLEQGSLCRNGRDDDEDGDTDCEDSGCASFPDCLPEDCSNEVDDNGDGLTDCDDPECADAQVCAPEDCSNEVDDDGDGHVDCQDEECLEDPACEGIEVCWNGVDDNRDGATDCEDEQCWQEPECSSDENAANGNCDDGLDNDGDGHPDCADPGCANRPPCDTTTCQADAVVEFESVGSFESLTLDLDTDPPTGDLDEPCGGSSSREKVVIVEIHETGRLVVAYEQTGPHEYGLYFPAGSEGGCADALYECFYPTGADQTEGVLDLGIQSPGTYILVVAEPAQGVGGIVEMTISLLASPSEELCGNAVDDDADSTTDCGDLDCYGTDTCQGSACVPDVDLGQLSPGSWAMTDVLDLRSYDADESPSCLPYGGSDLVVGFEIVDSDPTAHLQVFYDQSMTDGGDSVLALFFPGGEGTSCDAAENACRDTLGHGTGVVDFGPLPSGQFFLVAKALAGRAGKLQLMFVYGTAGQEMCDDGVDDDSDGLVDCDDPDCATAERCVVEQCAPGTGDEDGDGLVDCADTDPYDMCQCSYSCRPEHTCDGGQSGQVEHDPEIVFLGTCDVTGQGAVWSGTVDATNWYGPGQPARDDYEECPELAIQDGTPDVVLYFRIVGGAASVQIDYDNGELGVYHLADIRTADQCWPCDAGGQVYCARMPNEVSVSGSWNLDNLSPGDYVLIVADDLGYWNTDSDAHSGPFAYTITCRSAGP